MNITFCPAGGGEDQEEYLKGKILALHRAHPSLTGIQVNFFVAEGRAGRSGCQIDLTAYGKAIRVRRSAETYRQAADLAVAGLAEQMAKLAARPLA
ncbi:MAG TPA: hypothetical protein VGR89_07580 [Puia sp.]|nr:hypothetical protein [Puia sp.]